MREVILAQTLKLAVEHHINRDFPQAEALYRQILAQAPEDARPHNSLGNTLTAMSQLDEVVDCYLLCPRHGGGLSRHVANMVPDIGSEALREAKTKISMFLY